VSAKKNLRQAFNSPKIALMSQNSWSLFNMQSKERWESLSFVSALKILQGLPQAELGQWMCTTENQKAWSPVLTVAEFIYELQAKTISSEPNFEIFEIEPAAPEQAPMAEILEFKPKSYFADDTTEITQIVPPPTPISELPETEAKSGFDRRRYPRFDAQFRVIIRNQKLTYRTFSKDVSVGGVALEASVPQACIGTTCEIEIANPDYTESLYFQGRLLPNRRESKYFSFVKATPESLARLQSWLSHFEPQRRAE
jgi:hypothetical protein